MAGSIASNSSHGSSKAAPANRSNRFGCLCTKWRIIQWAVFVALVIGVAVATYQLVSQHEENDFEEAFQRTASTSLAAMEDDTQNSFSSLQTFGLSVAASNPVGAWPYVTIPNFAQQAENWMSQTHSDVIVFSPLVDSPTEWERYVAQGSQASNNITTYTYKIQEGVKVQDFSLVEGYLAPVWQIASSPASQSISSAVNFNLFQTSWIKDILQISKHDKEAKITWIRSPEEAMEFGDFQLEAQDVGPWSLLAEPVLATVNSNGDTTVVAFLLSRVPWGEILFSHRHDGSVSTEESILCLLTDYSNGNSFTYRIEGSQVDYLGPGDSWVRKEAYGDGTSSNDPKQMRRQLQTSNVALPFTVRVFPTQEYHDSYTSNQPLVYAFLAIVLLLLVALVFVLFEHFHDRATYEQGLLDQEMDVFAKQASNRSILNIHSSMRKKKEATGLPENNKQLLNAFLADQKRSHDRLGLDGSLLDDSMDQVGNANNDTFNSDTSLGALSNHSTNSGGLTNNAEALLPSWHQTTAVADLFPSATVLFADIAGFTAWSSVREPSKAFALLEALYLSFDRLAQKRRIFKVETIGDCYVAVCGLPERRSDHAVALCHYARGCLKRFRKLTHTLEQKLGPETSELALRVGVNSGTIMAGILRGGSSARFQLFGETVTMASKIEGAGQPDRIHVSKETATQLSDQGKGHWLQQRDGKIMTSKGELQTFWLLDDVEAQPRGNNKNALKKRESGLSDDSFADGSGWGSHDRPEQALHSKHDDTEEANSKMKRLVGWNCEVMVPLLKMIVARRAAENKRRKSMEKPGTVKQLEEEIGCHNNVLDEVEEVISLPHYDAKVQKKIKSDPDKVQLGATVEAELKEYVHVIAQLYLSNPFHNFEHASHVTMSTSKLLSRIVAPAEVMENTTGKKKQDVASELHDCTYGITSDPLTQFAVILSALIHDVDHRGVPNFILCKEEKELAAVYENKSVAEQNSVDIAWETLMDPRFQNLRKCIYANEAELKRFRLLLVNCVMSTDIFDKELSALRKARWEKAFSIPDELANAEDVNRKATIVIEHLIQASDVSHTMQHWHVYTKWNEKLFHEMYSAYRHGRGDKDPAEGWYKGEIWFFDNYVIPLAKKLHQCGVFGVSSDEYLTYAVNNRNEWEEKGAKIVKGMIDKYSVMMDVETAT